MNKHQSVLGALFIGSGILHLIGTLVVVLIFGTGSAILGAVAAHEPDFPGAVALVPVFFGSFIGLLLGLTSLVNLVAGYGCLAARPWASVVSLVVGVLNLPAFPFGTAIGVYSIWVFAFRSGQNGPVPGGAC